MRNISQELPLNGSRYGFFQLMRLLRLHLGDDQALLEKVRVRPNLSLGFPETDVHKVWKDEDARYFVEANFFGLYGVSSPLPTFYTEDLIDERMEGRSSTRDFLDIVHATLYPILFQAWEKYRIWLAVSEKGQTQRQSQLHALIGMHGRFDRQPYQYASLLMPHAGNLGWRPRSALGLQGFLRDHLGGDPVQILPCVPRHVGIPRDDRCLLGVQGIVLGESSSLGQRVLDVTGSLAARIGPLGADGFRTLLPGGERHEPIIDLILHYLETPLRCELRLTLKKDEVRGAKPGARQWSRLGLETWLGTPDGSSQAAPHQRHTWPHPVRLPLPRGSRRVPKRYPNPFPPELFSAPDTGDIPL